MSISINIKYKKSYSLVAWKNSCCCVNLVLQRPLQSEELSWQEFHSVQRLLATEGPHSCVRVCVFVCTFVYVQVYISVCVCKHLTLTPESPFLPPSLSLLSLTDNVKLFFSSTTCGSSSATYAALQAIHCYIYIHTQREPSCTPKVLILLLLMKIYH